MKQPPPLTRTGSPSTDSPPFAQSNERLWLVFVVSAIVLLVLLLLLLLFALGGGSGTGGGGLADSDGLVESDGADGAAATSSESDGADGDSRDDPEEDRQSDADEETAAKKSGDAESPDAGEADTAEKDPLGERPDPEAEAEDSRSPLPADIVEIEEPDEPTARPESGPKLGMFSRPRAGLFGINVVAEKVAYVLDVSSSMGGALPSGDRKQVRANEELMKSVKQLARSQTMTVVLYNTAAVYDPKFIQSSATDEAKRELEKWINARHSHGGTDPMPAMKRVLQDEYDAIFLVSDGEFHGGAPAQIKSLNKHNTVIHTIALNANSMTLKQIANESGGKFIIVK